MHLTTNQGDVKSDGTTDNTDKLTTAAIQARDRVYQQLTLTDAHRDHLKTSGLSDETIDAAGFRSVTADQAVAFGLSRLPGILIPYPGHPGYYRFRPDADPNSPDRPKYLAPAGTSNHLYIPPSVQPLLADRTQRLLITEGEKKTLKAIQEGFATIGVSGVWNWRSDGEPIPEFTAIKWKDRPVYLAYDSDLRCKTEVQGAMRELARTLEGLRATVRIVMLPAGQNGKKVGLDDYLLTHSAGDLQQLIDTAPTLSDAVLELIEPGLDEARLESRLLDVFKVGKMYPMSIPTFAVKVRKQMRASGYLPPDAKDIERRIRKGGRSKQAVRPAKPGQKDRVEPEEAAKELLNESFFDPQKRPTLRYFQSSFYEYQGTHYQAIRDSDMQSRVMRWLQRNALTCTRTFMDNVLLNLGALTHVHTAQPLPLYLDDATASSPAATKASFLSLKNGIIKLDTLQKGSTRLEPHAPGWFTTINLPYAYDLNAHCWKWLEFLYDVFEGDKQRIRLLQELFGYCLMDDLRFHKFFILQGDGANGKSVILAILRAMLGKENVSHLSLDQFNQQFSRSTLDGKLANICADLKEIDNVEEGLLKTLTAGEPVQVDRKYKDPYTMTSTAVLVFATNTLPVFRDRSQGIWRRLIVIPFDKSIPEAKQDRNLGTTLKAELAGILNWAIKGQRRLLQQECFTTSDRCGKALAEHRNDSDPVLQFLEERVVDDPKGTVATFQLYGSYQHWAETNGYRPLNRSNFGKALHRWKPGLKRKDEQRPTGIPGKRTKQRSYQGIRLLE